VPRKLLITLLAVAAVLGACGGETAAEAQCPESSPSPIPAPPYNDDPELAGRLPAEIAGQELAVQTVCITTVDPGGLPASDQLLEEVGVEPRDVTMAVAEPAAADGEAPFVSIVAFRYAGADEDTVRRAFLDTLASAEIEVEDETIAGKQVHRALFIAYHVSGDTLFAITGENPQVEEVLEALP
jgi:hypothetical protein